MKQTKQTMSDRIDKLLEGKVIGTLSGTEKKSPVFINNDMEIPRLKNLIKQEIKKELEECVKLADKIESEEPDGGTKQWMAFKHFRNTLRDKIKNL